MTVSNYEFFASICEFIPFCEPWLIVCMLVPVLDEQHWTWKRLHIWHAQRFLSQEQFAQLSEGDKLLFYENGNLDPSKLEGLNRLFNANFYLDWSVLKHAVSRAIAEIRAQDNSMDLGLWEGGQDGRPPLAIDVQLLQVAAQVLAGEVASEHPTKGRTWMHKIRQYIWR